jgi:CMP-N,N'-diacetyllegionaminic acid synthase
MKLAVIPAREGSKGLLGKNIAKLCGRELILYTVIAAIESQLFDNIVVTSDGDDIIKRCLPFSVSLHHRNKELAKDDTPLVDTVKDAVSAMESRFGETYDIIYTLQPTSPLRNAQHLKEATNLMESQGGDSLVSVVRELHSIWKINSFDNLVPLVYHKVNRQYVSERCYVSNGAIFITRRKILDQCNDRLGGKIIPYEMDAVSSIDIHSQEDLELASFYMRRT